MAWHDAIAKIKLPSGTVGKICLMVISVSFALAAMVVAVRETWVAIIAMLLLAGLALTLGLRLIWFADKHPQAALMEGAEFLKYKQIEKTKFTPARVIEPSDKLESSSRLLDRDASELAIQPPENTNG